MIPVAASLANKRRYEPSTSSTIQNFFSKKPQSVFVNSNVEFKKLEASLERYFATTSEPTRKLGSPEFNFLLHDFQPEFVAPGRKRIEKLLIVKQNMANCILKNKLTKGCRITIFLDICSKKSLTVSFLGVSACFLNTVDNTPKHVLIGPKQINYPHTGVIVAEYLTKCLTEWGLGAAKILLGLIVTDN